MINVTKTYLPPMEEYIAILNRAWENAWLTNNGILVQELEEKLKQYLNMKHLLYCNNGTIVLQMALKALNITGEVITTPFSYVATTNALLWENCKPVFVDINEHTFCIDALQIESAITERTQAILATHVYGYPCDVELIEHIALKYDLKVIYDGAHAFGTRVNGRSLLSYGDISTCSFHATKLFHTGEGGSITCNDDALAEKLFYYRSFGHLGDNYYSVGINGKASELHAAMGLAVFPYIRDLLASRRRQSQYYQKLLADADVSFLPDPPNNCIYNYAYFPVVFPSEIELNRVVNALAQRNIFPRRYFYPSLNTLPYLESADQHCPVSESISSRVLCLPLYFDLSMVDQKIITQSILQALHTSLVKCV